MDSTFETFVSPQHVELCMLILKRVEKVRNSSHWWLLRYKQLLNNYLTSHTMTMAVYLEGLLDIPGLTPMDICVLSDFAEEERKLWLS